LLFAYLDFSFFTHRYDRVENLVVVTHGLTMRFILMQLFGWSPHTFHTVWNAGNCALYVLQLDASLPGRAPYRLDPVQVVARVALLFT
jgi:broad specificity phosphatase PhoE